MLRKLYASCIWISILFWGQGEKTGEQVTRQPFLLLASILKLGYLCEWGSSLQSSISTDGHWHSYNMELTEDAVHTYVLRADSLLSVGTGIQDSVICQNKPLNLFGLQTLEREKSMLPKFLTQFSPTEDRRVYDLAKGPQTFPSSVAWLNYWQRTWSHISRNLETRRAASSQV